MDSSFRVSNYPWAIEPTLNNFLDIEIENYYNLTELIEKLSQDL